MSFSTLFLEALAQASRSLLRDIGLTVKVGPFNFFAVLGKSEETLDARLSKLDQARQNLVEALDAVAEMEAQANESKAELNRLSAAVRRAAGQKAALAEEVQTARALASLDVKSVQTALGMPTRFQRWVDRLLSFTMGIIASLL